MILPGPNSWLGVEDGALFEVAAVNEGDEVPGIGLGSVAGNTAPSDEVAASPEGVEDSRSATENVDMVSSLGKEVTGSVKESEGSEGSVAAAVGEDAILSM